MRAIAVAALAFLAAAPLVRCSRLSLDRRGGASIAIAIVIDDSMSMRAELPNDARRGGATTRFGLALLAAQEIAGSLRSGDVAAVILAGAPARVAIPATGEPATVRAAIDQLAHDGPSDRATDLDGALALAGSSLRELPHADRRIVLLSDLADGNAAAGPITAPEIERVDLEAPLDALRTPPPNGSADCALIAATPDGEGDSIRVQATCALSGAAVGKRAIEIVRADSTHARVGVAAFPAQVAASPATFDVLVPIDKSHASSLSPEAGKPTLLARITGEVDAISSDDVAPVLGAATAPAIAVVVGEGGALDEVVATGGPPVLERALTALDSGAAIRPLPSIPDREADLAPYAALAIDDPPGFGPETRDAIAKWCEQGGVLLLAIGPRAAGPPLGQSLEPLLLRPIHWDRLDGSKGIDPLHAGPFGDGASAPKDLAPKGRATFDREDIARYAPSTLWDDGAPLLMTRAIGRGEAWIVGLPFAPDVSDLPLRPSFLALLSDFVDRGRDRGAGARLEVGRAWTSGEGDTLDVALLDDQGAPIASAAVPIDRTPTETRATPRAIGAYLVTTTPKVGAPRRDVRAAAPSPREVDLAPRALEPSIVSGEKSGLNRTTAELSPALAWVLLLLAAFELGARALRIVRQREAPAE